jgi:hypothetical protein
MSQMSDLPNYLQHQDLQKTQKILREKYGFDAPSYVTLRRWASDRKLVSAERQTENPKRRALYSVPEVERIWLSSGRVKKLNIDKIEKLEKRAGQNETESSDQAQPGAAASVDAHLLEISNKMELLFDSVATLLSRVGEQEEMLKTCVSATVGLAAARATLMTKYDAADALKGQLVDQLRARIKDAEKTSEFDRLNLKISIQLSNLFDKVSDLQTERAR